MIVYGQVERMNFTAMSMNCVYGRVGRMNICSNAYIARLRHTYGMSVDKILEFSTFLLMDAGPVRRQGSTGLSFLSAGKLASL